MSDYTPTTEQVRDLYVLADPAGYKPTVEYVAEFDRWLEQTLQEAKKQALQEAKKQALQEFEGHADGCYIPKRALERLGLLELATATKDRKDDLNPSNSRGLDARGATNE